MSKFANSKFHKTGEAQQEAEAEEIGGTFDPVFFLYKFEKINT